MPNDLSRRAFLGTAALAGAAAALKPRPARAQDDAHRAPGAPIAIASGNGLPAVAEARSRMVAGADPLEAAVRGVTLVEDDPDDDSVGLGGLPNEEGVVELDASVMHGPTHRAGAVAALRNIRNPSAVALEVARRTDHVLLVGEGALRFARRLGFTEENLLTDKARDEWLRWRARLNDEDDWLDDAQHDLPGSLESPVPLSDATDPRTRRPARHHTGTIHCSALDARADLAGVTTTSGLSWKIPGRVGDSPIIGAGLYTDNDTGCAGATGRGEAVIQVCGARTAVERMARGDSPLDACLHVLKLIADKTRAPRLLGPDGRPSFNVSIYALRKDGAYASASLEPDREFAVCDANGARPEPSLCLYDT